MPDLVPDCPLCRPSRGVVLADDHWTLMLNDNQATLGRVFFALNRHETDVAALTGDELASLWAFLRETKQALTALFAPDHFNFMFLMNLTPHAHFHIFPRYAIAREFAGQTWEDSRFGGHYDPDESRAMDDDTMGALVSVLRHEISQPSGGAR